MVTRRHGHSAAEAGYNLVFLMVIVTVLNILVAAALPHWTTRAQREREEEAIFRGLQYAEAIRVFQNRFGRPPVRLQELVEVEPRSIRQLWGDPLNDGEDWGVLFAGQGGGTVRPEAGGDGDDPGNLSGDSGLGPASGQGQQQTQGPIAGVYSRAKGDAIKVFNGAESYEDWEFTVTLVTQLMSGGAAPPGNQPPANDPNGRERNRNPQAPQNPGQPGQPGAPGLIQPGGGPPDLSVRWLGRPWPEEIQSQMDVGAAMNQGGGPGGPAGGAGNLGQQGTGAGSGTGAGPGNRPGGPAGGPPRQGGAGGGGPAGGGGGSRR